VKNCSSNLNALIAEGKTMAGNQNSGGLRPTAGQNKFGVSATGGNGSAQGQPLRYTAGGNYGDAQENLAIQSSAPMSKSGVTLPQGRSGAASAMPSEPLPGLTDPTRYPDEPVTTGINMGEGAGKEVMASPSMIAAQSQDDIARLQALLPIYAKIAESPNASNATRNFYRWLRSQA
jgi:hypothetical protein